MVCAIIAALTATAVSSSGWKAIAAVPVGQTAVPPAVVDSLTTMFDAIGSGNQARFRDGLAPGFQIYENGAAMSGDQIYAMARTVFDHGERIEWSITQPQGRVEGDLAIVQYVNRGAITHNGVRQPVVWLETAALQHIDGHWKILFMQSQRTKETAASGR